LCTQELLDWLLYTPKWRSTFPHGHFNRYALHLEISSNDDSFSRSQVGPGTENILHAARWGTHYPFVDYTPGPHRQGQSTFSLNDHQIL
jgi:hypothetical protein